MVRQRVRERRSPLNYFGRIVTLAVTLALIWYGLMTVLLSLKVSPDTINSISGYRTAFDWLSGITPRDVDDTTTRAIIAATGVLGFLVFGYLAWKEIPRPYLVRHDLELHADERGEVIVEPRAIERVAEIAANLHPAVNGARGRYATEDLSVDLTVHRARDLSGTLQDVQQRVVDALKQHQLPAVPVNVTLADFDRRHKRDLD